MTGELGPKAERGGPVITQSRNGVEGGGSPDGAGSHFSNGSESAWLLVFTALGEAFGTPLPLLGKHPEMSHIGHSSPALLPTEPRTVLLQDDFQSLGHFPEHHWLS